MSDTTTTAATTAATTEATITATSTPEAQPAPNHSGLGGGWIFFIILLIVVIGGFGGWVIWSRLRAKRLGLPTPSLNPFASASDYGPSPARGGVLGWLSAKVRSVQNRRHAPGAYESSSAEQGGVGGGQHHNRRGLDPDEAWDTRVENETDIYGSGPGGYYEEQELGLRQQPTAYRGASSYDTPAAVGLAVEEERGRSRSREPDRRYQQDTHRSDPFGDHAERSDISLRGVSPRPVIDTDQAKKPAANQKGTPNSAGSGDSPTERRSMFRENM